MRNICNNTECTNHSNEFDNKCTHFGCDDLNGVCGTFVDTPRTKCGNEGCNYFNKMSTTNCRVMDFMFEVCPRYTEDCNV